jgi:integrase
MSVYKRGKTYWFRFVFNGRRVQRSTRQGDRDAAKTIEGAYRTKLANKEVGLEEKPRYTIGELLDRLKSNYELRGKASPQNLSLIKIAKEEFGAKMGDALTADDYDAYVRRRQKDREKKKAAKIASINRVGQVLRCAYRLQNVPYPRFSMPREQNARQGFFSPTETTSVLNALPDDGLRDFVSFGYLTGMRKGEIASLRWEFVRDGEIVLPGQYAKTGKPRTIPIEGLIADLVKRRETARTFKQGEVVHLSQFIFHRGDGLRIMEFRKTWRAAVKKAGCPGRVFHDLRRTACRDMIRSGVPQSVAMSITGHTTIATFLRYDITNDEDQRNAMRATAEYRAAQEKKITAIAR